MLIFTFLDLAISKLLYNPNCIWADYIQSYGTFPIMCIGIFCCISLLKVQHDKGRIERIAKRIIYVLMILHYVCYYMLTAISPLLFQETSNTNEINSILIFLTSTITLYIMLSIISVKKLSYSNALELYKIARIGFYLCLSSTILTDIIKYVWMRERFCNMSNPDVEFTMWFLPQSLNGNLASSSFPSGHVAQVACIIWCMLLPKVIPSLNNRKTYLLLHIISLLYVTIVMVSRIVLGKHYATDVLIGMMITVVIFSVLYRRTYIITTDKKEISHD